VLDDERHDAGDLGIRALDGAGDGVGCAGAAFDVVDAEAAAPEVRARPRVRDEPAFVEGAVDELGEVLAAGAVAAGQRLDRNELGEPLEHADLVERHVGLVLRARVPGTDAERGGTLRHRVAEDDHLARATQRGRRLGKAQRRGIRDDDHVEQGDSGIEGTS
jgi:hypothetical protein